MKKLLDIGGLALNGIFLVMIICSIPFAIAGIGTIINTAFDLDLGFRVGVGRNKLALPNDYISGLMFLVVAAACYGIPQIAQHEKVVAYAKKNSSVVGVGFLIGAAALVFGIYQLIASSGDGPVIEAARNNNMAQLREEYAQGPVATETAEEALFVAIIEQNSEVVDFLIQQGVDANAKRDGQYPAIIVATSTGDAKTMQLLIENGADVNVEHPDVQTFPLLNVLKSETISATERIELVTMLLEAGADVNAQNSRGKTALHEVAYNLVNPELISPEDKVMLAPLLIENGADKTIKDNNGRDVMYYAEMSKNTALIEILSQ